MALDEYIEYRCTVPRTLHGGVSPFHVVYGARMSSDGEHIETFSRQSAACNSFTNHLSVSYALSHCSSLSLPVFILEPLLRSERTTLPPPLRGGGCRIRISRSLDPLKVPCMSWLSKICRSRQPPSPFGPNWQFRVAWLTALNQLVLST